MIERIEIELSRTCNLSCLHCSVGSSHKISKPVLNYDDWIKIIKEFISLGGNEVIITGGEPLLYKDLFKLLKFIKTNGLLVRLYTAGHLINDGIAQQLELVDLFCVSLEGDEVTHESITGTLRSYEKTIQGLKYLKSMGMRIRLHFTPMKVNFRQFEHVINIANQVNAESIKILKFVPEGRGLKNRHLLALSSEEEIDFLSTLRRINSANDVEVKYGGEIIKNSGCSASRKIVITADGYALPCLGLRDCTQLIVGDVRKQNLKQIYMKLGEVAKDGQCLCEKMYGRL